MSILMAKPSISTFSFHSFFSEKYLLDLYYQSYKGFYYRHKGKVQLLEDTRIQQVGAEMLYFTNWKEKSLRIYLLLTAVCLLHLLVGI